MYTIKELDAAIENEETPWEGSWYEFEDAASSSRQWVDDEWIDQGFRGVDIPGIGRAELLEQYGGEGQGDDLWQVFKVTDPEGNERIFRRTGWYASYSGGDYDGPTEAVKGVEKVITVWQPI